MRPGRLVFDSFADVSKGATLFFSQREQSRRNVQPCSGRRGIRLEKTVSLARISILKRCQDEEGVTTS
jgi:hypothetical protein